MTFEDIKTKFKPKEGYKITACISKTTGRYVGGVYRVVVVNAKRKETTDVCVDIKITEKLDEFFKFLKPYLEENDTVRSN